jgi:NifB/MoaA-like Fe-S oxidoreductase
VQLAGRALGDVVLVPAVALRDDAGVFLDDLTPGDLAASLETAVIAVEPDAPAFLAALLGR